MSEDGRYAKAISAFRSIAMPVAIISAADATARSCATGTVMYVSLQPPQLLIALHPASRTAKLIRSSGEFSASLLSVEQMGTALAAGRSGGTDDKFDRAGITVVDPPAGLRAPGVADSLAILWCRVVHEFDSGDHHSVVGTVIEHQSFDDERIPLLRFRRRYVGLGGSLSDPAPERFPL